MNILVFLVITQKSNEHKDECIIYCLTACALGPTRLPPGAVTTLTNLLLY